MKPALRPMSFSEWVTWTLRAAQVRVVDSILAEAMEQVARGDDTAISVIHDRLNVLGRFEQADSIRRLMNNRVVENRSKR